MSNKPENKNDFLGHIHDDPELYLRWLQFGAWSSVLHRPLGFRAPRHCFWVQEIFAIHNMPQAPDKHLQALESRALIQFGAVQHGLERFRTARPWSELL
jgi:hypothetical protein